VYARFAPLADEPEEVRSVRGPALALGMDWHTRLPETSAEQVELKYRAIEMLAASANLAAAVYDLAD
jgi:hypothetical protein